MSTPRDSSVGLSGQPLVRPSLWERLPLSGPWLMLGLLAAALLLLAVVVFTLFGSPGGGQHGNPIGALASATPTAGQASPTTTDGGSTASPTTPTGAPGTAAPTAEPTPTLSPTLKTARPASLPPEELTGYVWPLHNARITSRFAPRAAADGGFVIIDGEPYHDGLDIATICGDKILAAHDGTVLYAGRDFDPFFAYWGDAEQIYARLERLGRVNTQPIVIVIDDGNGYRSVYVHLSKANVEAGQVVHAGDVIGLEGQTGYATGCHLHYGLIRMDGPWQAVVPRLAQYGYPPYVRERVDPLLVLPWGDQYAPLRLREKVGAVTPSPEPTMTPEPTMSPEPSEPTPTSGTIGPPTPGPTVSPTS